MGFSREQLTKFYNDARELKEFSEPSVLVRTNVDRYEEVSEFAHGGVKSIIKTKDLLTKREVAKAVMRNEQSEEGREQFLREAVINSMLEHPNIMPVYDIGFDDESPFFIMKFVPGNDLGQILKELVKRNPYFLAKYTLNNLLSIFIKVCDAVSYAHSKGIIHRDLKPANVKVGEFGEVLVCDWGLGKFFSDEECDETVEFAEIGLDIFSDGMTIDTTVKGTPGYMAPEQIQSELGDVCTKSDVYALGAILYTILAFKRPFYGLSMKQVLTNTVRGKLQLPTALSPHNMIPQGLEAVVMKAMCTDPNERYESVELLKDEVSNYLNGFATRAENASFLTQLKLIYQRNRRICLTVITFVLIMIFSGVYFVQELRKNEREALHALSLYKQEKAAKLRTEERFMTARSKQREVSEKYSQIKERGKGIVDEFITNAKVARAHFQLKNALKYVEKALSLDPGNKDIIDLKATVCIGLCKFHKVLDLVVEDYLDKDDPLAKIGFKYSLMPLNRYERLRDVDHVIALAEELVALKGAEAGIALLCQEHYSQRPLEDYRRLLKLWLQLDNPKMEELKMSFFVEEDGVILSLSGNKGLRVIKAIKSIRLKNLDLSFTSVHSVGPITSKPFLHTLNVAGSKVPNLIEIKKIPNLKKLIISEEQFPEEWLMTLPETVDVVVTSADKIKATP